jgi:hypothetical protein
MKTHTQAVVQFVLGFACIVAGMALLGSLNWISVPLILVGVLTLSKL